MPKRKSAVAEDPKEAPRRSTRRKASTTSSGTRNPSSAKGPEPHGVGPPKPQKRKPKTQTEISEPDATVAKPINGSTPPATKEKTVKAAKTQVGSKAKASSTASSSEKQYWLMKAEPESRLENGVDVAFSIDHLAAKTTPEPWDGIRAYAARNNLRAMKKGDLAFFYHSNCKEPGIVGTMEIVEEHSPDLSAHDPKAPYYDASSKPEDPKWSVVHVTFRSKLDAPITLKELREMGGAGQPLEHMQVLKQTRLSVSKVSAAEWEHIMAAASTKVN